MILDPKIEPRNSVYWYLIDLQACQAEKSVKLVRTNNLDRNWDVVFVFIYLYLAVNSWVYGDTARALDVLNSLILRKQFENRL